MAHDEFLKKQRTPEQHLAHVIEEAGEVTIALGTLIQAAGKTLRFGPDSVNPLIPETQRERNVDWLMRIAPDVEREMEDFRRALQRYQQLIEALDGAGH